MKKVLIHVGGGMGDIIVATPMISSLAKSGVKVDLLIDANPDSPYPVIDLFKSWPIPNFLTDKHADVESNLYDYYLMTSYVANPVKLKNTQNTIVLYASLPSALRAKMSDLDNYLTYAKVIEPNLQIDNDSYCGYSSRIFPEVSKKTVVICPGSSKFFAMKRWDKFDKLADCFEDIAIVGTKEDVDLSFSYFYPKWFMYLFETRLHYDGLVRKASKFFGKRYNQPLHFGKHVKNYMGQLDLLDTAALIRQAGLFIGNDSGVAHMAAAMGVPTLTIFGPSSQVMTRVYRKNIDFISTKLNCQPCVINSKVYPKAWRRGYIGCPIGVKCMTDLSVEEVYQKAMRFLKQQIN